MLCMSERESLLRESDRERCTVFERHTESRQRERLDRRERHTQFERQRERERHLQTHTV